MRLLPVLAVLMLATVALAAPESGRVADDLSSGSPVNDIAVSSGRGWIGAATDDPRTNVNQVGAFVDVWHYWDDAAEPVIRQSGHVDRTDCVDSNEDDCDSDATHIAISASGDRLVIAGAVDETNDAPNEGLLAFATRAQGVVDRVEVPGRIVALDMSDDGQTIAVLSIQTSGLITTTDDVHLNVYNWSPGATSVSTLQDGATALEPNLGSDPYDLDLSPDGQVIVVAADEHHRLTRASSTDNENTEITSPVRVVAVAGGTNHWSVAGHNSGEIALYSDSSPGLHESKVSFGGNNGVRAIAITTDGSHVIVGYADGRVRVLEVDAVDATLSQSDPVTHRPTTSAVSGIHVSADGGSVAVTSSSTLAFYSLNDGKMSFIWSEDLGSTIESAGISGDGERVAVAVGSTVAVFEAIHDVSVVAPSTTIQVAPDTESLIDLEYANGGNRPEDVQLVIDYPAGWFVAPNPATFVLQPDAEADVELRMIPAATAQPGTYTIRLNHTLAAGSFVGGTFTVQVPVVRDVQFSITRGPSADVVPGSSASFQFAVSNDGNVEETVDLEKTVTGAGWSATVTPQSLVVPPGEERIVDVDLSAPASAAEGAQATVTVQRAASALSVEFTAVVGASFGVSLTAPSGLEVLPGNETSATLTVTNLGNAPDSVSVSIGNSLPPGWDAAFLTGLDQFTVGPLAAGASATVDVLVAAPTNADVGTTGILGITAASLSDGSETQSRSILVNVVAPAGDGGDGSDETSPTPFPLAIGLLALLGAVVLRRR